MKKRTIIAKLQDQLGQEIKQAPKKVMGAQGKSVARWRVASRCGGVGSMFACVNV